MKLYHTDRGSRNLARRRNSSFKSLLKAVTFFAVLEYTLFISQGT